MLTDSRANKMQARKAGATRDIDGLPFARIAKVMCPANATASTIA